MPQSEATGHKCPFAQRLTQLEQGRPGCLNNVLHSSLWPLTLLLYLPFSPWIAISIVWLHNETVRWYVYSPHYEKAEIELTVATISNYNQSCCFFLDSVFAMTAPHGNANRIIADSSGALHSQLIGNMRAICLSAPCLTWSLLHKVKACSYMLQQEQIKTLICWVWTTLQHAGRPQNVSPFSRVVHSLISRCLLQSQLVCLTWSRGQKLL